MKINSKTFKATGLVILAMFACQSLGAIGITENLIGHWPLDESDTQNLQVVNRAPVAAPEHGVRTAGIEVNQPAPTGTGYLFNGLSNNDFVELGSSFLPALRLTNELTISAWINPAFLRSGSGANSRQTILGASSHLHFALENEGQFVYVYRRDGAFVTTRFSEATRVSAGEFIHVAITHEHDPDGFGDDVISLYVNGELYAQEYPYPTIEVFEIEGDNLYLGRYEGNTARDFDGVLSDIGLWAGRALSYEEIAVIGAAGRAGLSIAANEIDDLLALYDAGNGVVATGDWDWSYAANFVEPADGSALAIGKHYYGLDGNIYVILEGSDGSWKGLSAQGGEPFALPVTVTMEPEDQEVDFGAPAAFEVEVASAGPVSYQWFFGEYGAASAIEGETASTLNIESVGLEDEGSYFCRITEVEGDFSVETRLAQLTILNKPAPEPGLAGHWKLNETDIESLTVFNSAPGAIEHGLRTETMLIDQPSLLGRSYFFDGQSNDDSVELGSWVGNGLVGTNAVTVSAWVNPSFLRPGSNAASRHILLSTANSQFQFALYNGGALFFFFMDEAGKGHNFTQSGEFEERVQVGVWTHVAVSRNGSEASLYLNGVKVGHGENFPEDVFTTDDTALQLGGTHTARDFDGYMSDVGLWSATALSPAEISMIGGMGRIGLPLSSTSEIDAVLAMFDAKTGSVETGIWNWSYETVFPEPADELTLNLGRHYLGQDGKVYVILGGGDGDWQGVVAEAAELEGYISWVEANFEGAELTDPNVSGPQATPAGDGVQNLLKYAFGMDPKVPAPREALPESEMIDGELVFSYTRATSISDIDFKVEVSTDLKVWNSDPGLTEEFLVEDNGLTERVSVRPVGLAGDSARVFMRLRIVL